MTTASTQQVRAVGTAFLRLRPLLVGPVVVLAWALLYRAAVPRPQLIALVVGSGAMLTFFAVERWLAARVTVGERWLFASLCVTAVGLGVGCAVSGGLASPFLPMLFAPTVTAFAAFGRSRRSWLALALLALALLALAFLPMPFAALPDAVVPPLALGVILLGAALLLASVAGLSDVHVRAADALERLRDNVLRDADERSASLQALGAKVAHEIKNPLTAVKGLVQLLAGGAADDKARERFGVVAGEIERMEAILRDYLSFARPFGELRPESVPLVRLLHDVAGILEARAAAAGVTLEVGGDPGVVVRADPRRLTEALLNLAGNALEASGRGGRVALAAGAGEGGATLVISDGGRGMTAAEVARLGTPWVSGREGGTGLGVVLARSVVEGHGGTLRFESVAGRGTSVTAWLPDVAP